MKINLSKQEYANLLLMASIAERVICTDTRLDEYDERQESVTQTLESLCAYAPLFGMGDVVETVDGIMDLTQEYMEETFEILQEYEEEYVFWETGALLFARRDCSEKYSEAEWEALDEDVARRILFDTRMKYLKEWEDHGYARLRIVEDK